MKNNFILVLFVVLIIFVLNNTKNTFTNVIKKKIVIITAEDRNDDFIKYHDLNFEKYCDINGYKYIRSPNCSPDVSSTYWCKIHLMKKYLESGDYDYVIWADSDTIITDNTKRLETFIEQFNKDIIIGKDCKFNNSFIDINTGFFIIKTSSIGISFINDCLQTIKQRPDCIKNNKEQGEWAGRCYEQGVMNELYRSKKYNKYIYVDKTKKFIYTDCYGSYLKDKIDAFVVHLCGIDSEKRKDYFKKYI
jgi:hypothetical protein